MPVAERSSRPFVKSVPWLFMFLIFGALPAQAQYGNKDIPTVAYRAAFGNLYDGEYANALKTFQSEGRGAVKTATTRWIDSICYHTMVGECHYEMGQLPEALEHYNEAIRLYLAYSDWMVRVRFPATLQPARQMNRRTMPTWGQSKRTSRPADLPKAMPIGQGRLDANEAYKTGGIVQQAVMFNIDVVEIVRCTSLAIRRRTELLGPTCKYDPLTGELLTALSAKPGVPNHWSECWLDVQLGLAEIAAGRDVQGAKHLERGLLAAGQYDHPLTPVALFELGKIAMNQGDLKAAADRFAETTYLAAYYQDFSLLEEAFRYGATVHLVAEPKTVYPPLGEAYLWAKRNRLRQLCCSLLLSSAENLAALGQTAPAASKMAEAATLLARRDMAVGRMGARYSFLHSRVLFQQKKMAEGDMAVARAMDYMRHGSLWLLHMRLADQIYVDGVITDRVAMDLYSNVLRDPEAKDWSFWPDESLASLVIPHLEPLEHWFFVAMKRKEHERALEIADRLRRHRFFSSMPFGGRLESLRWILEGPEEILDTQASLHRRDLRVSLPEYDTLSKTADALRAQLLEGPAVAKDAQQEAAQKKEFADLLAASAGQESLLREIAVSRQPSELVFPPLRTTADVQKALPKGSALLVFLSTSRGTYAFLLNNTQYDYWVISKPAVLQKKVLGLLRELGQYNANREVALDRLNSTNWKKAGKEVLDQIIEGSQADFSVRFDQLIIVPDGLLWYVPFEALQVDIGGNSESLISRFQIRYAPTMGLAVSDGRRRKSVVRTGVVVGHLFPGDEDQVAKTAFEQLREVVPDAVALPLLPPAPSNVYRLLFDDLIVYDDILAGKGGVYSWEPIQIEGSKEGNRLADWLSLPWGGPQTAILPGFHTAAENGLKQVSRTAPGQEVFLSVCGLMASGTRTVLLSRWRVGGQTGFTLVREFVQELPHAPPAEAWQRAVLLSQDSRTILANEPRIKAPKDASPPKAEHPFFWAGYMLVDPGDAAQVDAADKKPNPNPQPAAGP